MPYATDAIRRAVWARRGRARRAKHAASIAIACGGFIDWLCDFGDHQTAKAFFNLCLNDAQYRQVLMPQLEEVNISSDGMMQLVPKSHKGFDKTAREFLHRKLDDFNRGGDDKRDHPGPQGPRGTGGQKRKRVRYRARTTAVSFSEGQYGKGTRRRAPDDHTYEVWWWGDDLVDQDVYTTLNRLGVVTRFPDTASGRKGVRLLTRWRQRELVEALGLRSPGGRPGYRRPLQRQKDKVQDLGLTVKEV